jgi:nucleotide-binding universal stress UspA family protein
MPRSSSAYRLQPVPKPAPPMLVTAPRGELQLPSAPPRPIIALGDDSEAALNAAWRAVLIAQNCGAPVRLLNLRASSSGSLERAGLLVTHVEDGCRPLDWLFGTRIEQLVRRFSIPVLIVKQPASRRYRHVLVGLKLEPQASDLVARARMFAPRVSVDVVHVLGTSYEYKLRLAEAEAAIRAHRTSTRRDAYRQMNDLIAAACGHEANAVVPRIVVGSAPDRLLELGRATRAALIVLGKRPGHWLADFFLDRGVARRVLAEASSDVLLVPYR